MLCHHNLCTLQVSECIPLCPLWKLIWPLSHYMLPVVRLQSRDGHLMHKCLPYPAISTVKCQKHSSVTGTSEANITVAANGSSVYDVSMADLAHVLLPDLGPVKLPRFAQRTPKWLQKQRSSWLERQVQQAYCSLTPAACEARPLKHISDLIVDRGSTQDVQVINLFCSLT